MGDKREKAVLGGMASVAKPPLADGVINCVQTTWFWNSPQAHTLASWRKTCVRGHFAHRPGALPPLRGNCCVP
jgi:hypothetical protein